MANFCTKCGTTLDPAARFCDNCGAPVMTPAAASPAGASMPATPPVHPVGATMSVGGGTRSTAAPAMSRKMITVVAAATVAVIAGGALLSYVLAPEAASQASFTRAVGEYLARNPATGDRLACIGNLPYRTDPIRVAEYDRGTREWMETLSSAGLYAPAVTESGGGYFPQTQFVYKLTDTGRASIRDGKLCAAAGIETASVTGFDNVNKSATPPTAIARATLALRQEAPWLAKSPRRAEITHRFGMDAMKLNVPLVLTDKKWRVSDQPAQIVAEKAPNLFGMMADDADTATEKVTPAPAPGFFARLKAMLPGGGPSLVGKWTDQTGMVHMEFTSSAMITNGISQPVTYQAEGDHVTVSAERGGPGVVFTVPDAEHLSMNAGVMTVRLTRVR